MVCGGVRARALMSMPKFRASIQWRIFSRPPEVFLFLGVPLLSAVFCFLVEGTEAKAEKNEEVQSNCQNAFRLTLWYPWRECYSQKVVAFPKIATGRCVKTFRPDAAMSVFTLSVSFAT